MLVGSSSQKSQLAPGQGCGGTLRVPWGTPARSYGTDHAVRHLANACYIPPPRLWKGKGREGKREIIYQAKQQPAPRESQGDMAPTA